MNIRVSIIQHSPGTPPGTLLEWARERGLKPDLRLLFSGSPLPDINEFDLLVSLGGPMNVDDVASHPWLAEEKTLLRETIRADKACLGLCLGGQLMAQALGGEVRKHLHWEAGWHSVKLLEERRSLMVFQWHQDTFSLPSNAELVATNEITANQGFRLGLKAIGLQFHPEADAAWVRQCASEGNYPHGSFAQTPDRVIAGIEPHLAEMRAWFFRLLDDLAGRCEPRGATKYP